MAGAFDESGLMPHLPADTSTPYSLVKQWKASGFKVEICEECEGYGAIVCESPFDDRVEDEQCKNCGGTGRVLMLRKTISRPFKLDLK